MATPAQYLKAALVDQFQDSRPSSSDEFFQSVLDKLPTYGGIQLGDRPFPVDGNWLVLVAVFRNNNEQGFFFAMFNTEKKVLGLATDKDPKCPKWLIEMAEDMVTIQNSSLARNQGGTTNVSTTRN